MDFGKAFTYVFDDPDWLRKVAINALIGLIPIVGQLYLMGWGLEVARRVVLRNPTPLPDVDFGTHLAHGFKALVIGFVYAIPIWIFVIPIVIVSALATNTDVDPETMATISMVCSICGGLFSLVYGLLMGLALPAAWTRAVVENRIGAGLQVGAVLGLVRAAPGAYLLVLVGTLAASFVASLVGTIACAIGIIFTIAYYQAVAGHFYGQAYREATQAPGAAY